VAGVRTLGTLGLSRAGLRRGLALAVVPGVAAGALVVVQAALLSRVVDEVFLGGTDLAGVATLLLGIVAVSLARAGAVWGQEVAAHRFSARVRQDLRGRLARQVLSRGPRYAAGERAGELQNTLVGGVESLDAFLAQYLPATFLAAAVPLLVLAAVLRADPFSALVLLATFPLIPLFTWLIGSRAKASTERQWVTLSRLSARFLDGVRGLATLKAFGRAQDEAAAIEEASERYRRVTMGVLRLAFLSALVLELLATLGTAVVAVEVGLRLLYARMAFGEALFVLILTPEFYRPLRTLGAAFHAGLAGREAAARIREVLAEEAPIVAPAVLAAGGGVGGESMGGDGPPRLELDAVHFAYGADRPAALDGASFVIQEGSTTALVGPTGAGKTTVVRLLLRFLEPQAGLVRVDGQPLRAWAPEDWRREVAWVPQTPRLFHGSLLDNVELARPGATREEVERAAAAAHLEPLLRELPRGWSTPVGEGGQRLSGGEAQRVALARAFLKDAPVLLLDEPTGHLDPEREAAVLAAIRRLRRGRTVLLVAHRITTVIDADCVVLLDRGRVVESGRHEELQARGTLYPALVAAWRGAS
jgi:thiol reductant ABC exporter CydD subunit